MERPMSPLLTGDQIERVSRPPARLVSLVPSLTGSLGDLGLADPLVGVTDFCPPLATASGPPVRVGGPKTPDVEKINELRPQLVLANQEENEREALESLSAAGLTVWLTFPRSVPDALQILWHLAGMFRSQEAAEKLRTLERAVDWTTSAAGRHDGTRYFCPIWQAGSREEPFWWMTFNHETYCHDVLARCGGQNTFAERERQYPLSADLGQSAPEPPGERDTRYPRVTVDEIREGSPQVILLPSEPFGFEEADAARLREMLPDVPAVQEGRIHLVDGPAITWHGTRVGRALVEFPSLFQASGGC
jgi:iron complex transport system substrate-binding protein